MLLLQAHESIAARLGRRGETLHAPEVLDIEVLQVLRRLERARRLRADRAGEALADFSDLRIARYPHLPLLQRRWELRANLSAFAAAYVALAEILDAPLVTADAALARAARHRVHVELYR